MPSSPPVRVFIVGCPRSGTTIIQAMLGLDPQVLSMPETHFFATLYGRFDEWLKGDPACVPIWSRRFWRAPRGLHARLEVALQTTLEPLGIVPCLKRRWFRHAYVAQFIDALDQAAMRLGRSAWIEKTPDHLAYIDVISAHLPDAFFIHVVRKGEDVVASAIDAEMRYSEQKAFRGGICYWTERYQRAVETHLRFAGQPRHLIVSYEDFLSDPAQVKDGILNFVGLKAGSGAPISAPRIADLSAEPWKFEAVSAEVRRPRQKFDELFGPAQKKWIRNHLPDYDALRRQLAQEQQPIECIGAVCSGEGVKGQTERPRLHA